MGNQSFVALSDNIVYRDKRTSFFSSQTFAERLSQQTNNSAAAETRYLHDGQSRMLDVFGSIRQYHLHGIPLDNNIWSQRVIDRFKRFHVVQPTDDRVADHLFFHQDRADQVRTGYNNYWNPALWVTYKHQNRRKIAFVNGNRSAGKLKGAAATRDPGILI